jgi:hypothetical protein
MSTYQPAQPFRYLDLPGEIRNNIYDVLFCSWDDELEPTPSSTLSKRNPSYSASAFLRTNKQLHNEAFDYMTKRNQFVRVSCRGLDVRDLFLEDGIPIVTTNPDEVSRFNGYVMHMILSKAFSGSRPMALATFEMMVLRADLPKLCEKLDIESVMTDANAVTTAHTSLQASIRFNYAYASFLTPRIQEHLLKPIATAIRGLSNRNVDAVVPNLHIGGPVDPSVANNTINEVAKPRWTDPESILAEIHTGVDVGKRQWQQNNYYAASEAWNYSMRTLERMRHSSSWLGLQKTGGEDFVNRTADLYFTLNLLSAAFLQVDMAGDERTGMLLQRNGSISLQHLHRCETASARFAQHAGATWMPSNQQHGKMMYRHARCLRLMRDAASRVRAVVLIEQAVVLAPNDLAIRDEKDAVLAWNADIIEKTIRSIDDQFSEAEERRRRTIWSWLRLAVSSLGM